MMQPDETFFFDDGEDPTELLRARPEIRQNLGRRLQDDELGLRSLLDWADPSPPSWTHQAA